MLNFVAAVIYLLAAGLSLLVYRNSQIIFDGSITKQKRLWLGISVVLFLLCLDKQFNLQTLFTAALRDGFREIGLYEQRRIFQRVFIAVIVLFSFTGIYVLTKAFSHVLGKHFAAISGLVLLLSIIMVRATSYHDVDTLEQMRVLGLEVSWIAEMIGLSLIGFNGLSLIIRKV